MKRKHHGKKHKKGSFAESVLVNHKVHPKIVKQEMAMTKKGFSQTLSDNMSRGFDKAFGVKHEKTKKKNKKENKAST